MTSGLRELRIALVGDHDPSVTAHRAIPLALALAAAQLSLRVEARWLHTTRISGPESVSEADAVWCVPASPYANPAGALAAIRFAREQGVPFLGTCGGFQHALLEAAAGLWNVLAPAHAELHPAAADPVIAPLACSLVEVTGTLRLAPGSRVASAYGRTEADETYHCRYGLSPRYAGHLAAGPLRASAWDPDGDVRAVELDSHPFYVATLFQPERAALGGITPPLALAFLQAIQARVAA